jgi:hypothetical protein
MALMNRWEFSNFLDSRGQKREWTADYMGEVFVFNGLSTAVNMENGLGKSSAAEGVLGVLSWNRDLMGKTVKRIAPSRPASSPTFAASS